MKTVNLCQLVQIWKGAHHQGVKIYTAEFKYKETSEEFI